MLRLACLALTAAIGFHATDVRATAFGTNPLPAPEAPGGDTPAGSCGPVLLTQTTSQTAVPGTIACLAGSLHAENSYYREYGLSALPNGLNVCAVELAIESSNAGDPATSQPLTINLYSQTGGAFPGGTRTPIGTATVQVPDGGLRGFSVPVTGSVPAGQSLVVEALLPNGQPAGHSMFLGSNAAGQSGPSFLRAPACGAAAPATLAALGFPNVHMILNARGSVPAGLPPAVPVPGPGGLALLIGALALVGAGVFQLRRRMT
ncbi:MAG: hypothetical protein ACK558_03890 [Pseudomonadota bacterium]